MGKGHRESEELAMRRHRFFDFPFPHMKKAPDGRFFHVRNHLVGAAGFEPTTPLFAINNLAEKDVRANVATQRCNDGSNT